MAAIQFSWQRVRSPLAGLLPAVSGPVAVLAGLLALQVVLFAPSWNAFFCGDSVFYLSRVVEPTQLRYLFTHPDAQGAYRPLTYLLFSWVFYPLFGLDPFGYHLAALGLHLLGCMLVYRLLRKRLGEAASLAGLFFFSVHATNFYTTYDLTFLPDLMALPCWLGLLLCYTRWIEKRSGTAYFGALACFLAGLLSKETLVMLPLTLALWTWLLRTRETRPAQTLRLHGILARLRGLSPVLPFLVLDGLYLAWTAHIKYGLLYPGGVYGFTLRPADLLRKGEYLIWLANLPTGVRRAGWPALAAAALMIPALLYGYWLLVRAWRGSKWELMACGAWAAAALAPLLCVTQVPMKHNLYVPLVACALAMGIALESEAKTKSLLGGKFWRLGAAVALCVAIQVRLDLRYSWVGEGSRIAQASLEAVRRVHPVLPHGALLYVLPSEVRGNAAWYFDNGGLFRVFYRDASLRMAFADAGQPLPADFAARDDVFVFRFAQGRLYDVTAEYAGALLEPPSYRLLDYFRAGSATSKYQWRPADLPPAGPVYKGIVARGDVSREALVMMPGTSVRLPVPAIPPGSSLSVGVTTAGARIAGTQGRIDFEHDGVRDLVTLLTLDSPADSEEWQDTEVDLSRWAGRAGILILSTVEDPSTDWLAWSQLRLELAGHAPAPALRWARSACRTPALLRLLDRFRPENVQMDRREPYPDYAHFETPTGTPAFFQFVRLGERGRLALVTLAGTRVSFQLQELKPSSVLLLSLGPVLQMGDGMEGRIFFEREGSRRLLLSQRVFPQQRYWKDLSVALGAFAGQTGQLVLECGSGPAGDKTADWLAWGGLRIETRAPQGTRADNRIPGDKSRPPESASPLPPLPTPARPASVSE